MLDAFKKKAIVNKVGGRFKLSALIQKRMVALNRGARPLVELQAKNQMEVVVEEIMQDKIFLDASGAMRERTVETVLEGGPSDDDTSPTLADL